MIWYLVLCMHVNSGTICQPPQQMPDRAACAFVAKQYRTVPYMITHRCVGVRKPR